jgi:DNA transposition AAA+ family ATPase
MTEAFENGADHLAETAARGAVSMLVAPSGAGKSWLLRGCAVRGPSSVLHWPADVINSPLGFVQAALGHLGLEWHGSTRAGLAVLRTQIRQGALELVLIDDAQRLYSPLMDVLRQLHDDSGLAVALCGPPRLGARLLERCPELWARVWRTHLLGPVRVRDVYRALRGDATRGTRDVAELRWMAVADAVVRESGGNFRRLTELLGAARSMARAHHRPLSADLVTRAARGFARAA